MGDKMSVRAIRGATTVEDNDKSQIISETKSLLSDIIIKNNIAKEDVISAIFTLTKDLNATFPAIAARELGWTEISLMCTSEIDVPGSLRNCIRVLLHINTDKSNSEIRHVYLKDAKVLRTDIG